MKKITLIIAVVLVTALLSAYLPVPRPLPLPFQRITGTLRYSHNNICMIQDYIALPVMDNVYLVGKGFPTHGQVQGCWLTATGTYQNLGSCRIFQVASSKITCPESLDAASLSAPDD